MSIFTCLPIRAALMSIVTLAASTSALASDPELNVPPEGFITLFNGEDLTGWCGRGHVHPEQFRALAKEEREKRQAKADADLAKHWKVENGEIVNDGHGVFCTTVEEYGDFELLVDWKMVKPHADSGIYLRGTPQVQIWDPDDESQHKHGAQLGSGGLWNNNRGSDGKDPLVRADNPIGEWNTFRIQLVGDRATIHLNDKLVVDDAVMHNFWDRKIPLYKRGPIQLQTHGGEMRFRNVFIRPIEEDGEATSAAESGATSIASVSAASPPAEAGSPHEAYTATIPGTEVTFDMVPIPAGEFLMGSPDDEEGRNEDEGPQVRVRVEPFWMGKHEVTWAEYQRFMELCNIFGKFEDLGIRKVTDDNRVDAVTAPSKLYEPSFTFATGDAPNQPAVSMTQFAAKQYTKWLSLLTGEFYRLPSEAEWEYACRAETATAYSFGDDVAGMDEHGLYYENGDDPVTGAVGHYKANAWGLFDMHGNAREWTLDQYSDSHYAKFAGRTVDAAECINWPTKLTPRVLRGGSWDSDGEECRSAARFPSGEERDWKSKDPNTPLSPWWFASDAGQTVGFRLVRPLNPPPRSEWTKYWDSDLDRISEVANKRINEEGKGEWGLVDPDLPAAIKQLDAKE